MDSSHKPGPWLLLILGVWVCCPLPPVMAQPQSEPAEPCGREGQTVFACLLNDGRHVAVCGLDSLQLDVRLYRGDEVLWVWPEEASSQAAHPEFFFERQTHVRSVSYHLWFERDGRVFDLVDHWTDGSHDSHFAGLIVQGPGDGERQTVSCDGDPSVLRIQELADRLPHRAVPVL